MQSIKNKVRYLIRARFMKETGLPVYNASHSGYSAKYVKWLEQQYYLNLLDNNAVELLMSQNDASIKNN